MIAEILIRCPHCKSPAKFKCTTHTGHSRRHPHKARREKWEELRDCPDCRECKRAAYSDGTTPGFFYDKCEKHRKEDSNG